MCPRYVLKFRMHHRSINQVCIKNSRIPVSDTSMSPRLCAGNIEYQSRNTEGKLGFLMRLEKTNLELIEIEKKKPQASHLGELPAHFLHCIRKFRIRASHTRKLFLPLYTSYTKIQKNQFGVSKVFNSSMISK